MAKWTVYPDIGDAYLDDGVLPLALGPESMFPAGSRQRTISVMCAKRLFGNVRVFESNPTASQDVTQGYTIGSRFFNKAAERFWICTDATEGAAVWQEIAGSSSFDPDVSDVGYTSNSNGTTKAKDQVVYDGSAWVAGRPARGVWYRPASTKTLALTDHNAFVYADGENVEFPDTIPTGFSFTVFSGSGSGSVTVSRTGSTTLVFVGNQISGANSVTVPDSTFATFWRVSGDTIAVLTAGPPA
jgi:hypothetical protein